MKRLENYFKSLESVGVDMDRVYEKLLEDGLKAFQDSFKNMVDNLRE